MGSYYLIANKTKKEFISHGCINDLGIHRYPYLCKVGIGRLLIYLLDCNGRYDSRDSLEYRFDPNNKKHFEEGFFQGHWAGDELYFVNDNGCIIDTMDDNYYEGLYDAANYAYTDITFPAADDYNKWVMDDESDKDQRFELNETYRIKDNFSWRPYEEVVLKEKYSEEKRNRRYESDECSVFMRTPILFKRGDKVKMAYTMNDLKKIQEEDEKEEKENAGKD